MMSQGVYAMTMWQRANRHSEMIWVCIILVVITLIPATLVRSSDAQQPTADFAALLSELDTVGDTVYIEFVTPVLGENAWFVPEDILLDEQIVGQRFMGEIGTDYVCVNNVGSGMQNTSCVPFSNIAFIAFGAAYQ